MGRLARERPPDRFKDLLFDYPTLQAIEERGHDDRPRDDPAALGVGRDRAHPELPNREAIEVLRMRSATSPAGWRTYLVHARVDPLHCEELRGVLDEVPCEPRHLGEAIVVNALRCVSGYAAALDSVCRPANDVPAARAPP